MMEKQEFNAPELTQAGSFEFHQFSFKGSEQEGWFFSKESSPTFEVGIGYKLLKTQACGICSTDLARAYLPYPLPQIVGHEVVVTDGHQRYCLDINASHHARQHEVENCPFCSGGLETHCPDRITLGINQLPGGFSPYLLAPRNALHHIPKALSTKAATLIEPLAAAMQALKASPPKEGDHVAVLGPRRLGMLILMALFNYRSQHQLDFKITALIKHPNLRQLCHSSGADEVQLVQSDPIAQKSYDLVFDTTGHPDGFQSALKLSKRELHLKSTHGQAIVGMTRWADFVVDELALSSKIELLNTFQWPSESQTRENKLVWVSPAFSALKLEQFQHNFPEVTFLQLSQSEAFKKLNQNELISSKGLPRFDAAIFSDFTEFDQILRPDAKLDYGLVRPRGLLIYEGQKNNTPMSSALKRGLKIQSSRCGEFKAAIQLLENQKQFHQFIEEQFITHTFALKNITEAFQIASNSKKSIKVVVHTD